MYIFNVTHLHLAYSIFKSIPAPGGLGPYYLKLLHKWRTERFTDAPEDAMAKAKAQVDDDIALGLFGDKVNFMDYMSGEGLLIAYMEVPL